MFGAIFLPQQEQRHAAPLQFPVHCCLVGQRPCRLLPECRRREQPPLDLAVVHPFRHRPVMPITAARRRYSPTVDRPMPTVIAICRSLTPRACRSLKTSRTFRIGALSAGIRPPLAWPQRGLVRDSIAVFESVRPVSTGGGRLQSEWVAGFHRNQWPACVGLRTHRSGYHRGAPRPWQLNPGRPA